MDGERVNCVGGGAIALPKAVRPLGSSRDLEPIFLEAASSRQSARRNRPVFECRCLPNRVARLECRGRRLRL